MTLIRAKERDLKLWSSANWRARYDYDTEEYIIDEVLDEDFFGGCHGILKKGDYITITDAEDQIVTVRVDYVDKKALKIGFSKMERLHAHPVVPKRDNVVNDPGLTYRWRSTRGGGHSIITAKGELFAVNFSSKDEAVRAIENIYETKIFSPPPDHVPTRLYAKNVQIYSPD